MFPDIVLSYRPKHRFSHLEIAVSFKQPKNASFRLQLYIFCIFVQKILPILGRISTISEAKVYELSKVSFIEKLSRLKKENWSKVIQFFEGSSTLTISIYYFLHVL